MGFRIIFSSWRYFVSYSFYIIHFLAKNGCEPQKNSQCILHFLSGYEQLFCYVSSDSHGLSQTPVRIWGCLESGAMITSRIVILIVSWKENDKVVNKAEAMHSLFIDFQGKKEIRLSTREFVNILSNGYDFCDSDTELEWPLNLECLLYYACPLPPTF